jgi:hypothetical protein
VQHAFGYIAFVRCQARKLSVVAFRPTVSAFGTDGTTSRLDAVVGFLKGSRHALSRSEVAQKSWKQRQTCHQDVSHLIA